MTTTATGILTLTTVCKSTLSQLFKDTNSSTVQEWVEVQLKELNLWARTLGVYADGNYSIEHRLADNQQVTGVIIQLLSALRDHLRLYYAAITKKTLPSNTDAVTSDDEDSSSDSSESSQDPEELLQQRIAKIESGLGRLGRLAIRLRRDGAERAAKAALNFQPIDTNPTKTPLTPAFEEYVKATLAREFDTIEQLRMSSQTQSSQTPWPKAEPDGPIQEKTEEQPPFVIEQYLRDRLMSTMVKRWKRICYNRHHASALAGSKPQAKQDEQKARKESIAMDQRLPVRTGTTPKQPQQQQNKPTLAAKAISEATKIAADVRIESKRDLEHAPAKSIITKVRAGELTYPAPPAVSKGITFFDCPFCGRPESTDLLRKSQWQVHVMHDLQPYICVFRNCTSEHETYATFDDWMAHITAEHSETTWTCTVCPKQDISFHDSALYEEHLYSAHTDQNITAEKASLFVSYGAKQKAPLYEQCRFDGFVPEAYLNNWKCDEAQDKIIQHMCKNMQRFALNCMPWDLAGADGRSSYQPAANTGSGSVDAKREILDDDDLAIWADDAQAAPPPASISGVTAIPINLAEIKKRWDSTLKPADRLHDWLLSLSDEDLNQPETSTAAIEIYTRRMQDSVSRDQDNKTAEIEEVETTATDADASTRLARTQFDSIRLQLATLATSDSDDIYESLEKQQLELLPWWKHEDLPWCGSVMHVAVSMGSLDCIKGLCARDLWRNVLAYEVDSPVPLAVQMRRLDIVTLLLEAGFHPGYSGILQSSSMGIACALGSLQCISILLEHGIDINTSVRYRLGYLEKAGHLGKASKGLSLEIPTLPANPAHSLHSVHGPPLAIAVVFDQLAVMEELILRGATPCAEVHIDSPEKSSIEEILSWCASNNKSLAIKLLLDAGASSQSFDHQVEDALVSAASAWALESLATILEHFKVSDKRDSALYKALLGASYSGMVASVKMLISHGAHPQPLDRNQDSCLESACEAGHLEIVELLLDSGADVNNQSLTSTYGTALCAACSTGEVEIVKLLIQRGALVEGPPGAEREIPITWACCNKNVDCLMILLENGADVRQFDLLFNTALHISARYNYTQHAAALLAKHADVNALNHQQSTPLLFAAYHESKETALLLLEHGAKVDHKNADGWNALHLVANSDDTTIAQQLLKYGADLEARTNDEDTALHLACYNGYIEMVDFLLAAGADMEAQNSSEETAIFLACRNGGADTMRSLIQNGANTSISNIFGESMLEVAVSKDYSECFQLLLEAESLSTATEHDFGPLIFHAIECDSAACLTILVAKAGPHLTNSRGEMALEVAVKMDKHDCVRTLLQHKAIPNARDTNGTPYLHIATAKECIDCTKLLLEYGADVNATDDQGRTALLSMAGCFSDNPRHNERIAVHAYLILKGASIDTGDNSGRTALMCAAEYGCLGELDQFIERGASLDQVDKKGMTALIYSSYDGWVDKSRTLVEAGAMLNIRDLSGMTALTHALKGRWPGTASELLRFGASVDVSTIDAETVRQVEDTLKYIIHDKQQQKDVRKAAATGLSETTFRLAELKVLYQPAAMLTCKQIVHLREVVQRIRKRVPSSQKKKVAFAEDVEVSSSESEID